MKREPENNQSILTEPTMKHDLPPLGYCSMIPYSLGPPFEESRSIQENVYKNQNMYFPIPDDLIGNCILKGQTSGCQGNFVYFLTSSVFRHS